MSVGRIQVYRGAGSRAVEYRHVVGIGDIARIPVAARVPIGIHIAFPDVSNDSSTNVNGHCRLCGVSITIAIVKRPVEDARRNKRRATIVKSNRLDEGVYQCGRRVGIEVNEQVVYALSVVSSVDRSNGRAADDDICTGSWYHESIGGLNRTSRVADRQTGTVEVCRRISIANSGVAT